MKMTGSMALHSALMVLLLLFLAGCGSGTPALHGGDAAAGYTQPATQPAGLAEALGDLLRLAADDNGEFHSQRAGSEFAADLPLNRCEVAANAALLSPVWQAGKQNERGNSAYCLYRLRLYQTLDDATLTLNWEGYDPPDGSCWIGLADWQSMCWRWQELPATNQLKLTDMAVWASGQDQCYAAVVLLDEFPRQLAAIGFGDIEPPEPPAQYNLFAPYTGTTTYLTDMDGNVVHSWQSEYNPAASVYLLPNGHLLHTATLPSRQIMMPGGGGRIEEFDWDGNLVWSFDLSDGDKLMHHDIEPLPDGNILAITWYKRTADELIALGRDPTSMSFSRLYIDSVLEIEPRETGGGQIVWEWDLTDHFIQDYDADKPNYGDVSAHPELVNVNYNGGGLDWTHVNGIDYNADLDQIVLSVHGFNELWIIDHGTTTEEAAGHTGGRYGHGGDLLYRWGNPQAYGAEGGQQWLYGQHDVEWIPEGCPGAGNLTLFNNRFGAPPEPDSPYSTVLELVPPINEDGTYTLDGAVYGPAEPLWRYKHVPARQLFSVSMGGCQRLPNGDTVICCADKGWFLEVNEAGELIWEYTNEFNEGGGNSVFRVTRLSADYPGLANLAAQPE